MIRILIVDDQLAFAEQFRDELNFVLGLSASVVTVERQFQVALAQLESHNFDVYIVDLFDASRKRNKVPRLSGLQLIEKIREFRGETPLVVAITSGGSDMDILKLEKDAIQAGANQFHLKSHLSQPDDRIFDRFAKGLIKGNVKVENNTELPIPIITSTERKIATVVAVDTVSFSSRDDDTQLAIVKGLVRTANELIAIKFAGAKPVVLFTGDGFILVFVDQQSSLIALELGLEMLKNNRNLAAYDIRVGVNLGDVFVARMGNGTNQIVGHAVNWCCRVMDAAGRDSLAVSDTYHSAILSAGRRGIPGVTFTHRVAEDKLGNPIPLFDATIV